MLLILIIINVYLLIGIGVIIPHINLWNDDIKTMDETMPRIFIMALACSLVVLWAPVMFYGNKLPNHDDFHDDDGKVLKCKYCYSKRIDYIDKKKFKIGCLTCGKELT